MTSRSSSEAKDDPKKITGVDESPAAGSYEAFNFILHPCGSKLYTSPRKDRDLLMVPKSGFIRGYPCHGW